MAADGKQLLEAWAALKARRSGLDRTYEDLCRYLLPRDQDVVARQGGESEEPHAMTSRPADSVARVASGLFSDGITPGQQWFQLRAADELLNQSDDVAAWLTDTSRIVLRYLGRASSNFTLQVHEMLQQYVALGTGVLFGEMRGHRLVFHQFSVRDCWLGEDYHGSVDSVFRLFRYTARQAAEDFGYENLPAIVKSAADKRNSEWEQFEFLHVTQPRMQRKAGARDAKNMPWESITVFTGDGSVVRESGYPRFPYFVPRFYKIDRSPYGRSVTHTALPDVRMLNRMLADVADAFEMALNPPVFLPDQSALDGTRLVPGAVNYFNPSQGAPVFYKTGADLSAGAQFAAATKEDADTTLMRNAFSGLPDTRNMSATEVVERVRESVRAVSPVCSRLQSELYSPMVLWATGTLLEAGLLPEPPADLAGADIEVAYSSRLDARMAQLETVALLQTLEQSSQVVAWASAAPQFGALYDLSKVLRTIARNNNVAPDLLRSEREEKKAMDDWEARQRQAEQMAAMQSMVRPIDPAAKPAPGSPLAGVLGVNR